MLFSSKIILLLCFCTEVLSSDSKQAENGILDELVKTLHDTPTIYEISFYSSIVQNNHLQKLACPVSIMNTQVQSLGTQRKFFKYSQRFHLIIYWNPNRDIPDTAFYSTFYQESLTHTSLFLFITNIPQSSDAPNVFNISFLYTPAVKIMIDMETSLSVIVAYKILPDVIVPSEANWRKHLLSSAVLLHKTLNYNYKGINIPAHASLIYPADSKFQLNDLHTCATKVFRNLKLCDSYTMSILEVGNHHNATLEFHTTASVGKYRDFEYLRVAVTYSKFGDTLQEKANLKESVAFSVESHKALVYCLEKKYKRKGIYKINFELWCTSVTAKTLVVLSLIVTLIIIINNCGNNSVGGGNSDLCACDAIAAIFGNSTSSSYKKRKLLIFMNLSGMWLCSLYSNEIASVVTIKAERKPFDKLLHVLDFGFKIIWPEFLLYNPWSWEIHFHEFERRGILQRINRTFYYNPNRTLSDWEIAEFMRKKHMTMVTSTGLQEKQLKLRNYFRKVTRKKKAKCYVLPDKFDSRHYYFVIQTRNRHWMKKTYENIREAGLLEMWNLWAGASYRYSVGLYPEGKTGNRIDKTGDLIKLFDIMAILLFYGVLLCFAAFMLLLEVLLIKRNPAIKRHFRSK